MCFVSAFRDFAQAASHLECSRCVRWVEVRVQKRLSYKVVCEPVIGDENDLTAFSVACLASGVLHEYSLNNEHPVQRLFECATRQKSIHQFFGYFDGKPTLRDHGERRTQGTQGSARRLVPWRQTEIRSNTFVDR